MNGIKCERCGLVNLVADNICRRCEQRLVFDDMPRAGIEHVA